MTDKRVPWLSIFLAGVAAFGLSMATTTATVAGYAMALAIKAQGQPDPGKIAAFANRYMPYLGSVVLWLLVLVAARWVARRARSSRPWYGVLVGVVATLPTLVFIRRADLRDLLSLILPLFAGWLGALWGAKAVREVDDSRVITSFESD